MRIFIGRERETETERCTVANTMFSREVTFFSTEAFVQPSNFVLNNFQVLLDMSVPMTWKYTFTQVIVILHKSILVYMLVIQFTHIKEMGKTRFSCGEL